MTKDSPKLQNDVNESGRADEVKYIAQQLRRLETITNQIESLVNALAISDGIFRDLLAEIPEQLDRLESAVMLLVNIFKTGTGRPDPATKELENQIIRNHISSLRRQLKQHTENRDSLAEEAAQHGPAVPLPLANGIRAENVKIDNLESEIEHFKALL